MADTTTKHTLMGGKLHVYRRANSGCWQCSTYLAGRNHRVSTKTESLARARDFANDWYLGLHGKLADGQLKNEKTFKQAADTFEREYEVITEGQRHPRYVKAHKDRLRVHLVPFFGKLPLSEVSSGKVQEYRVHRREHPYRERLPSRSTLHQEMVTLRQTLKTAMRHGWLTHLPDLSTPYRSSGKVSHRGWFSPEEYRQLYTATRERAKNPKKERYRQAGEQLHDYVLFMANTGLRPDEASRLEFRDVKVVEDIDSGETILEIQVRGKRGVGYCKSTRGAVRPFERLRDRARPKPAPAAAAAKPLAPPPTARLFPLNHRALLNAILTEQGLKADREGTRRTAYSLRHTYICTRLVEGADIYQVAKNCRTSVEMIETFYAAHIRTSLNAAAINVRRARPKGAPQEAEAEL